MFVRHLKSEDVIDLYSTSSICCCCSCSVVSDSLQPMDLAHRLPCFHCLPELAQNHVHWVGDAIQPSYPLSSPSPPTFNLSQHQDLFQWVSSLHQMAKVLEFQLQHQSLNEHSELISFKIDWLDLLAVQGTLKGLLQHHSSKSSILQCSAFFIVQLLHPYSMNSIEMTLNCSSVCQANYFFTDFTWEYSFIYSFVNSWYLKS